MDDNVKNVIVSYAIQHGSEEVERQAVRDAVQQLMEGAAPEDLNAEALKIAHDDLAVFYYLFNDKCDEVLQAVDELVTRLSEWRR